MKQVTLFQSIFLALLCAFASQLVAQDKAVKGTLKLDLLYQQTNDQMPLLKTSAKTKKGKKFEPVDSVDISIFLNEEAANSFIARITTNSKGTGTFRLPERFRGTWESSPTLKFIATSTGNEKFEDQSTEIEITKARIVLTLEEKDSVRKIHALVEAYQDSAWAPVPETEIKFVVRRLLTDFPAAEEETYTTDERGEASAEFQLTLPGDLAGNIEIGAKIDESDMYGTIYGTKTAKWGVPLKADDSFSKRSLWATRNKTPLWLLIFPNLIIACVWGTIFYLFYHIRQIIKLGKAEKN